jgi:hypothetical protein
MLDEGFLFVGIPRQWNLPEIEWGSMHPGFYSRILTGRRMDMFILKVFAFLFLIAGFGTVFAAKSLVARYGLDQKVKCDFESEMTEDELKQYKFNRASVNLKMMGLLISIPGLVLVLIAFK